MQPDETAEQKRRLDSMPIIAGTVEPKEGDFKIEIRPSGNINGHYIARLDGERYEYWPGFGWRRAQFAAAQ